MNISLPPALRAWVESQVESGRYGSVSEYIRHLLREAQVEHSREAIDRALLDGIASGFRPLDDSVWKEIRERSHKQPSSARSPKARRKKSA